MSEIPPWPWQNGKPEGEIVRRAEDAHVGAWVLIRTTDRVYRRDNRGRSIGGAVERYTYRPSKVLGETKISWLVGPEWMAGRLDEAARFPKKRTQLKPEFYGLDDVEDRLWVGSHRRDIADALYRVDDRATLERIAQIIGYREVTP